MHDLWMIHHETIHGVNMQQDLAPVLKSCGATFVVPHSSRLADCSLYRAIIQFNV